DRAQRLDCGEPRRLDGQQIGRQWPQGALPRGAADRDQQAAGAHPDLDGLELLGPQLRGGGVVDDQAVEAAQQLGAFGNRGWLEGRCARASNRWWQIERGKKVVRGWVARQDATEVVAQRHAGAGDVLLGDYSIAG